MVFDVVWTWPPVAWNDIDWLNETTKELAHCFGDPGHTPVVRLKGNCIQVAEKPVVLVPSRRKHANPSIGVFCFVSWVYCNGVTGPHVASFRKGTICIRPTYCSDRDKNTSYLYPVNWANFILFITWTIGKEPPLSPVEKTLVMLCLTPLCR